MFHTSLRRVTAYPLAAAYIPTCPLGTNPITVLRMLAYLWSQDYPWNCIMFHTYLRRVSIPVSRVYPHTRFVRIQHKPWLVVPFVCFQDYTWHCIISHTSLRHVTAYPLAVYIPKCPLGMNPTNLGFQDYPWHCIVYHTSLGHVISYLLVVCTHIPTWYESNTTLGLWAHLCGFRIIPGIILCSLPLSDVLNGYVGLLASRPVSDTSEKGMIQY